MGNCNHEIEMKFFSKDSGGRESNNKETISCAGCFNAIEEDEFIQALSQEWHIDCFR